MKASLGEVMFQSPHKFSKLPLRIFGLGDVSYGFGGSLSV